MDYGKKTPADSLTEQVHILTKADMNGNNRLFGGQLMSWIDMVAGVAARRHSNRNITTALVDTLEFREPARANDLVVLRARVVYTGRTSMVVKVESFVEQLNGSRLLINSAFLTLVALDDEGKPTPVPGLLPQTEEDMADFTEASAKTAQRKAGRIKK